MAKLRANGTELLRINKEINHAENEHTILRDGTDLGVSSTEWDCYTRVYCSNGKILQKIDVRFRPNTFNPKGRFYSYGWKVCGKIKKDHNIHDLVAKTRQLIAEGKSKWVIESGNQPKPVIISQTRIVKAIESGEMLGFCKSCGAMAHGVEPDASNYRCESCGQMEVYGAEEMLIAG